MIARWMKLVVAGLDQPAIEYSNQWKRSAEFDGAWLLEVPEETVIIGFPQCFWYTPRGMYRRKDVRSAIEAVMKRPMPRANGLVTCIWTRREILMGSVTEMRVLEESEDVQLEAAILWNWVGHIVRQPTPVQRAGGLFKEFDRWLSKTDPILPKAKNSPPRT